MTFAWIDWILLAIIGFGLWRGTRSGFFQQAAGIVGLIGGFLLAAHLMPAGGAYLSEAWGIDANAAPLVAFILIFLVLVLLVLTAARFFDYLVGVLHVGLVDRALGGLFGALQVILLLSVLFWFSGQFDWPSEQTRTRSALIEPIEVFAGEAWDWTRRAWPEIEEFYDRIGDRAREQTTADAGLYYAPSVRAASTAEESTGASGPGRPRSMVSSPPMMRAPPPI